MQVLPRRDRAEGTHRGPGVRGEARGRVAGRAVGQRHPLRLSLRRRRHVRPVYRRGRARLRGRRSPPPWPAPGLSGRAAGGLLGAPTAAGWRMGRCRHNGRGGSRRERQANAQAHAHPVPAVARGPALRLEPRERSVVDHRGHRVQRPRSGGARGVGGTTAQRRLDGPSSRRRQERSRPLSSPEGLLWLRHRPGDDDGRRRALRPGNGKPGGKADALQPTGGVWCGRDLSRRGLPQGRLGRPVRRFVHHRGGGRDPPRGSAGPDGKRRAHGRGR